MLKDENLRFMQLVEDLKATGKVADYVQLATVLGTNKAGISDIKSGRKKISVELLRRMKLSYPSINLNWIIMGVGEMYCLESGPDTEPIAVTKDTALVEFFRQFNPVLEQKDEKLMRQAEEIGRLREQLEQARRDIERLEAGKNVTTPHHVPEPIDAAT